MKRNTSDRFLFILHPSPFILLKNGTAPGVLHRELMRAAGGSFKQGRSDLNAEPAVLETAALPVELHPSIQGSGVSNQGSERQDTAGVFARLTVALCFSDS